ncbi:hypothetical protein EZY14_002655 [Kordia sp. TARA_039_SRF]|nr:hypothetical protein EZY14_002655 [Kordia sp. TARA_039_SRF]
MKNIILLMLAMLATTTATSQNQLSVLTAQDVRLLFTGSETYPAGTLNVITRIQAEGYQDKYGYATIFAEYEVGDLQPNYNRYSLNVAYTFNKLFVKNVEASAYAGFGFIDRGFSVYSFGFGGSINYKLNDDFKINGILQIVDRKDLGVLYDTRQLKASVFVGVSYNIKMKK